MIALACRASGTRPLLVWLLRGCAGVTLLVVAVLTHEPFIIIAALATALVAFGGCPMCWTLGLVDRVRSTFNQIDKGKGAP